MYLEKIEVLNNCILKTFGLKLHYQMGTKQKAAGIFQRTQRQW